MGKMASYLSLCLAILLVLLVLPTNAQTISKPSIPEFSVQYFDSSNYIPRTTTVDPYTGDTVTKGGYYNFSEPEIRVTIKNQPFTTFYDASVNKTIGLFYQVRGKGHFAQDWVVIASWLGTAYPNYPTQYPEQDYSSLYTVLDYKSGGELTIPHEGQMDFQVQAGIGFLTNNASSAYWFVNLVEPDYVLTGETSDFSPIQTLIIKLATNSTSIPSNSVITSPNQATSPAPTVPEFPITASLVTILAVVSLLLVIGKRKLPIISQ